MAKIFSYDTLYQSGVQIIEFGHRLDLDPELDYVSNWDIINLKINGHKHNVAIPGNINCKIMGAIVNVPDDILDKVDKYKTKAYKRIKVKTLCGNECQMYVKR